jgi:hypothetical protein
MRFLILSGVYIHSIWAAPHFFTGGGFAGGVLGTPLPVCGLGRREGAVFGTPIPFSVRSADVNLFITLLIKFSTPIKR